MSVAATKSKGNLVGLGRFELPTSPLSGVRSNQLSYRPILLVFFVLIFVAIVVQSVTYYSYAPSISPQAPQSTQKILRQNPSINIENSNP